jgi:hypothetical protein
MSPIGLRWGGCRWCAGLAIRVLALDSYQIPDLCMQWKHPRAYSRVTMTAEGWTGRNHERYGHVLAARRAKPAMNPEAQVQTCIYADSNEAEHCAFWVGSQNLDRSNRTWAEVVWCANGC